MSTGKIVGINVDRGFAFVEPDDGGDDVFLHQTTAEKCGLLFDDRLRYQRVKFEAERGPRGLRATRVEMD